MVLLRAFCSRSCSRPTWTLSIATLSLEGSLSPFSTFIIFPESDSGASPRRNWVPGRLTSGGRSGESRYHGGAPASREREGSPPAAASAHARGKCSTRSARTPSLARSPARQRPHVRLRSCAVRILSALSLSLSLCLSGLSPYASDVLVLRSSRGADS